MLKKLFAKIVGSPKPKKGARKKPAARKPAVSRRKAAPARPKKKPEKPIGEVVAFFRIPVVAVIRVTQGILRTGEKIWIRGHTTNLKMTVASMQMDHQPIPTAKKGQEVGVKIPSRARRGDRVFRLPS